MNFKGEKLEPEEGPLVFPAQTYDTVRRFTVEDLKAEYPEWESHYGGDADLTAISYVRTRFFRQVAERTHVHRQAIGGIGLKWAIDHTAVGVGMQYDAHGIAEKGDPVTNLDKLLRGGIDRDRDFYSMGFLDVGEAAGAFGAEYPFTQGGFIVAAEFGKKLLKEGVKYVVVGEEYTEVLDILRKRYPKTVFVPWNEAPKVFTEESNAKRGVTEPFEVLTKENQPTYYRVVGPRGPGESPPGFIDVPLPPSPETGAADNDVW